MQTRVHQNPRTWGSYANEVQNVRRFIKERVAWMDKKLGYTFIPSSIADVPINYDAPYEVFTLSGRHCGKSLDGLARGVYVVRQGGRAQKVIH